MYIYMRAKGHRFVINKPTLIAAAINLVMFTSFLIANKLTTAANTIVLQFTEPVWVILFAWLLFKSRPRKRRPSPARSSSPASCASSQASSASAAGLPAS